MRKAFFCAWMLGGIIFASTIIHSCFAPAAKILKKNKSHFDSNDESIANGEILAAKYCESCHLLPLPDQLNSDSWATGVLPHMGPRLGIFEHLYEKYPNNIQDQNIGRSFYPAQPLMSSQQWQSIIDYYTATSPDTLPKQQRKYAIENGLTLFKVLVPEKRWDMPATSMVKIETVNHEIYTADIFKKSMYRYNDHLQLIDSFKTGGNVVDVIFQQKNIAVCNIGIFTPVDGQFGSIQFVTKNNTNTISGNTTLPIEQLMRPVTFATADFNGDGLADYVAGEFGYLKGRLSWQENMGNGTFKAHLLREVPGAIKVIVNDFNHDGLPDIWVLFAQGDEGIFLFTNKGNGKFEEKRILRFPPMYGSSYFEMVDLNKDGFLDIVYTCGDNGDYSTVLKSYHGIYIYLNDGKNNFQQKSFFPMNGCYKAIARDFDNDGDIDIAAIAYFADFKEQPNEGFIYLENKGNLDFKPYSLIETQVGRWISMDAADVDGDGKTDLVLGNCSVGPTMMYGGADWKKGPPFIVLKNMGVAPIP